MEEQASRYEAIIKSIKDQNVNATIRTIGYQNGKAALLYIQQLIDKVALSQQVIKPLTEQSQSTCYEAQHVLESIINVSACHLENDENQIENHLLAGMAVLIFTTDNQHIIINVKKVEQRSISTPELTYTLRGPKDSFTENLDTNLSLIRYRIKSSNLKIDMMNVGKRTKTDVAVLYFDDIANDTCVNEVKKRINQIDVDGILESGELQAFMLNNKRDLFPQMGLIERSDMASGALLEGKVVILVEGSGIALIVPEVFSEFLWSCEDCYDNKYVGLFMRLLRVLALFISFTISSIYVAIVAFHSDTLPSNYLIALAEMRAKVPFNALLEVLLIEIIIQFIRDALIRVPTKMGSAIGIVGAIIIGQAAISAGIFSPLLLIVLSTSLIASFLPSDYTLYNSFRVLKFLLIMASGTFGFFGFTLVLTLILANLVSINTFGVPYMAPFAPFNFKDALNSFIYNKSMAPHRPHYLRTKDRFRSNPVLQQLRKNKDESE